MSYPEPANARNLVYGLLIVIAAGTVAGRICSTSRVYEPDVEANRKAWPAALPKPVPTFGSNDRSRWATVRALVDEGTFAIGKRDKQTVITSVPCMLAAADPLQSAALAVGGYQARSKANTGITFEDGWFSVDKVLHPQSLEFYSSKPPLLATLVAGLYWLLQVLTGWTLRDDTFAVVRTILIFVNLLPFVIYLWVLTRIIDRYAASDWSRFFVFAAGCFATLLTPFLITFNNHTVATCCVLFAVYPMLSLLDRSRTMPAPWAFALSGLMASFTVCNELPAAAFAAALFGVLLLNAPRQTLMYFLPAALIPLGALALTNYISIGELSPAYSKFGGPWYEYEGSHWHKPSAGEVKYGIDWARMHESQLDYAFNVLVGHHGIFSLSPIWLLAAAGMVWAVWKLRRRQDYMMQSEPTSQPQLNGLAVITLGVTVLVIGFYLVNSDNYGGWTSGLRWLMWLTPLWLLAMVPVVDWLGERRWGRWLALGLLAWSVFSVSFRTWNPWRHPWLYDLLESGGYIPYKY